MTVTRLSFTSTGLPSSFPARDFPNANRYIEAAEASVHPIPNGLADGRWALSDTTRVSRCDVATLSSTSVGEIHADTSVSSNTKLSCEESETHSP